MTISNKPEDINSTESILHYLRQSPKDSLKKSAADLIESLQAKVSAPLVAVSNSWQPIETAPKDSVKFVGYDGKCAFLTHLGKYYVKWPHEEGGPTYRNEWNAEDASSIWPWNPTHWMPLPAAPGVAGQVAPQATVEPLTDEQIKALIGRFELDGRDTDRIIDFAHALLAATPPTSKATEAMADAYVGAREDWLIWKKRALEAEDSCRRLTAALNEENGPTFMGEPVAISKADTGKVQLPKEATPEIISAMHAAYWGEPVLKTFDNMMEESRELWRKTYAAVLKSATPSTIKAEPTGEKL